MAEPRTTASELPTLTPLRGLAALLVVLFHYTTLLFPALEGGEATAFFRKGYLAVDLFFLMSGCVIAHVYGTWFRSGITLGNLARFARARFARLYPLHLAVLALFLVFLGVHQIGQAVETGGLPPWPTAHPLSELGESLLLIHGLSHSSLSWNFASWSISAEVFAYLVFPFAAPLLWRPRTGASVALIAGLFATLAWLSRGYGDWSVVNVLPVLRCLIQFLIGVLLYRLHDQGLFGDLLRRDTSFIAAAVSALFLLHLDLNDLAVIAAFAVMVLAGIGNGGQVAKGLHARPLTWLGDISYSVYMTHVLLLQLSIGGLKLFFGPNPLETMTFWQSFVSLLIMLGVLLLLSDITYRRIEVPARKWLKGRAGTASLVAFHRGSDGFRFGRAQLVMPGLDTGIQGCRSPLDCRKREALGRRPSGNDSCAECGQGFKPS